MLLCVALLRLNVNAWRLVSIDRYAYCKLWYLILRTEISVCDSICFSLNAFSRNRTIFEVSYTCFVSSMFCFSSSRRLSSRYARIKVESSLPLFFKRDVASSWDFRETSCRCLHRYCFAAFMIEDDNDIPSPSSWSKSSRLLFELPTRDATANSGIASGAIMVITINRYKRSLLYVRIIYFSFKFPL